MAVSKHYVLAVELNIKTNTPSKRGLSEDDNKDDGDGEESTKTVKKSCQIAVKKNT